MTMTLMTRARLVLATLLATFPVVAVGQAVSVLHIRVVLTEGGRTTPVPDHALLISDNPSSAPPRRVVTGLDGTADVRLRPGNYTVESDRPLVFQGKAYQWTETVDVVAGRDSVLELSSGNAGSEPASPSAAASSRPEADASSLLTEWQNGVVPLWTPTTHASGLAVDARGLLVTNQRVVGNSASVEVQLAPDVKVAAKVVAADQTRDVAVLWMDPAAMSSLRPLPLDCAGRAAPALTDGQEIVVIDAPLRQQKGTTSGNVSRVDGRVVESDIRIADGGAGGPVFAAQGAVVGITSFLDDPAAQRRGRARVVPIADVCEVVSAAEKKLTNASPPSAAHLPVEPTRPYSVDALKDLAQRRVGSLNPYQMSSADFDIAFVTPVMTYGAQYLADQASRRARAKGPGASDLQQVSVRPTMDFGNWSEYVADFPPVLFVRVTPKLVEGFWTKVARGAAQTQGVALPQMKRSKAGFARMQAFCGETEVTPIHPFKIEQRVTDTEAIDEGFYVFDPAALAPSCGSVRVVLYSEKEPAKGDSRVVEASIVDQIWRDFESYRAQQ